MLVYRTNSTAPQARAPVAQQDCPCCGQSVPANEVLVYVAGNTVAYRGVSVRVDPQMANLLALLSRHFPRVVAHAAIYQELWPGDRPLTVEKCVQVYVNKLNNKLRPLGLRIENSFKRGYRLVRK